MHGFECLGRPPILEHCGILAVSLVIVMSSLLKLFIKKLRQQLPQITIQQNTLYTRMCY